MKRTIAALSIVAALAALTACSSDSSDDKPAAKAPAYTITHQDDSGNQRHVQVEVNSTDGLRAVFDDVSAKLTDDAGWFVEINCSSGGTAKADNRLANGRKAVGRIGAAATGLADGETEFQVNDGATCP